jgi:hypothetical protein
LPRIAKPTEPPPPYPRDALFTDQGPIHPDPTFDSLRTMFRNLPMEPGERDIYRTRRMNAAMRAAQALEPRDEIELMLAVQAVNAHYHAAARWRASMDPNLSDAESLRQANAAAAATRVFDTMLRAVERRQARPMAEPPRCRDWYATEVAIDLQAIERMVRGAEPNDRDAPVEAASWPDEAIRQTQAEIDGIAPDEGNPAANGIEGVNPDGSIIVPENATDAQKRYIGRRIAQTLAAQAQAGQHATRLGRQGMTIKPLRPGDWVP